MTNESDTVCHHTATALHRVLLIDVLKVLVLGWQYRALKSTQNCQISLWRTSPALVC